MPKHVDAETTSGNSYGCGGFWVSYLLVGSIKKMQAAVGFRMSRVVGGGWRNAKQDGKLTVNASIYI